MAMSEGELRELKGKYNLMRNICYVVGVVIMIFSIIFFVIGLDAYYGGVFSLFYLTITLGIAGLFYIKGYESAVERDRIASKIPDMRRESQFSPTEPRKSETVPPVENNPVGKSSNPSSHPTPHPNEETKICPDCDDEMKYIEEHQEWYCDNCQEYK